MNKVGEIKQAHGKQGKAWVFREEMRKIAADKVGRAMILLAIEDATGEKV